PGYGFLAENFDFANKVECEGVKFIGPSPKWINIMSHKSKARSLMEKYGMLLGEGTGVLGEDKFEIIKKANHIGYPVLVKPAAGGGGIGMLPAYNDTELIETIKRARDISI